MVQTAGEAVCTILFFLNSFECDSQKKFDHRKQLFS